MTHTNTIEYRIMNTGAGHVFSERFRTEADASARIQEYKERGDNVEFLVVVTQSAPKFHHMAEVDGL